MGLNKARVKSPCGRESKTAYNEWYGSDVTVRRARALGRRERKAS